MLEDALVLGPSLAGAETGESEIKVGSFLIFCWENNRKEINRFMLVARSLTLSSKEYSSFDDELEEVFDE